MDHKTLFIYWKVMVVAEVCTAVRFIFFISHNRSYDTIYDTIRYGRSAQKLTRWPA